MATPWTESEQLAFEKETLGLYWSGHPADRYAADLKEFGARTTVELADAACCGARRRRRGAPAGASRSSPTRASAASSPRVVN